MGTGIHEKTESKAIIISLHSYFANVPSLIHFVFLPRRHEENEMGSLSDFLFFPIKNPDISLEVCASPAAATG
jgi:hypothetical protein